MAIDASGNPATALAWAESPLQLLTAAEWAHHHRETTGGRTAIAYRISDPQVVATAERLHRMAAPFTRFEPYYGVPWSRLANARHWVIGDPLSGQFRAAAAVLPRPHRLTIVDDGAMVVHTMRALAGEVEFARPGQTESRTKLLLGGIAAERIRRLARARSVELFTAFPDADRPAGRAGIPVIRNRFRWLRDAARRGAAPELQVPAHRLVLGSARAVDGLLRVERYLQWVRELAEQAPLGYLPHRRETSALIDAVAALPGVTVVRTGLPVELALAGNRGALDLHALPSSATTTLATVLAGTGSVIHAVRLPERAAAPRSPERAR